MANEISIDLASKRFIEETAALKFQDLIDLGGQVATNEYEFEKMRNHITTKYEGMEVMHSYVEADGQVWDCVPFEQQPSVRSSKAPVRREIDIPFPGQEDIKPDYSPTPEPELDRFGNKMECPSEAIPMRRVTLADMARFPSFDSFFEKAPGGGGHPEATVDPEVATSHKYAHASQVIDNVGGTSTINVWQPEVDTASGEIFSLSQQWWSAGTGTSLQTVECGWQVYPQMYNNTKSHLFIYFTPDGYKPGGGGCYNLDCSAFVQTSSKVEIGSALDKVSVISGTQVEHYFAFIFWDGKWYFAFGEDVVGYYPGSLFGGGQMSKGATRIDFGGETVGSTSWPEMGSGEFADQYRDKAAYQRNILYATPPHTGHRAALSPVQPSPDDYTINVYYGGPWFEYFYFGGPGEL